MALTQVLADFARTLVRPYAIGDVLYRLTDAVLEVFDVAGAGVSIDDGHDQLCFVTATDEATARVERAQEESQEGPCWSAFDTGEIVVVDDVTALQAWPVFTAAAVEVGRLGVLGVPMHLDSERVGSLDIYAEGTRNWASDDVAAAGLLADVATGYVLNARAIERTQRTVAQLQQALDSRVLIEQAKGILAAERRITVDQAFTPLRAYARSHNLKIHEVARRVVEEALRP